MKFVEMLVMFSLFRGQSAGRLLLAAFLLAFHLFETRGQTPSEVQFASDRFDFLENTGEATLQFRRSEIASRDVYTVRLLSANPASPLRRIRPFTNEVAFAAASATAELKLTLLNDRRVDPSDLGRLELLDSAGKIRATAALRVHDDDGTFIRFAATSTQATEWDPYVDLTLMREGVTTGTNRVELNLVDLGPYLSNFQEQTVSRVVNFAPGEETQTLRLKLFHFPKVYPDRTLRLEFRKSVPAATFGPAASVLIADVDSVIQFFETDEYVPENSKEYDVWLKRKGALHAPASVLVSAVDGSAINGRDFRFTPRRVTFNPGETIAAVPIEFIDNATREGVRSFRLTLSEAQGFVLKESLDVSLSANIQISDDEYWTSAGSLDPSFTNISDAPDVAAVQSDGKILAAGIFSFLATHPTRGIGRLHPDGSVDREFRQTIGMSCGAPILAHPDGRIFVTADSSASGVHLRVLQPNGATAASFQSNPKSLHLLSDGAVLVNEKTKPWKITRDNQRDSSFDSELSSVEAIVDMGDHYLFSKADRTVLKVNQNGRVLGKVPGAPNWMGSANRLGFLAWDSPTGFSRIHYDGTEDLGFTRLSTQDPANALDSPLNSIPPLILADGRIIARTATGLARFFADGTQDSSFYAHLAGRISSISELPDGRLVVAGSQMLHVNTQPIGSLTVLKGDETKTPAKIRWNGARFSAAEQQGKIFLPVLRLGDASKQQTVQYKAISSTAIEGQDFAPTSGTLVFDPGQRAKNIEIDLISDGLDEDEESFEVELEGDAVDPIAKKAVALLLADKLRARFETNSITVTRGQGFFDLALWRESGRGHHGDLIVEVIDKNQSGLLQVDPLSIPFTVLRWSDNATTIRLIALDSPMSRDSEELQVQVRSAGPQQNVLASISVKIINDHKLTEPQMGLTRMPNSVVPWQGKLIVQGAFNSLFSQPAAGLAALSRSGKLEWAFDSNSKPFGRIVGIDADGKIVLGEIVRTPSARFGRVLPNGKPDPDFNGDYLGQQVIGAGLLRDGSIVSVESVEIGSQGKFNIRVVRLNHRGFVESAHTNRTVVHQFPLSDCVVYPDGRILLVGAAGLTGPDAPIGGFESFHLWLDSTGALDPNQTLEPKDNFLTFLRTIRTESGYLIESDEESKEGYRTVRNESSEVIFRLQGDAWRLTRFYGPLGFSRSLGLICRPPNNLRRTDVVGIQEDGSIRPLFPKLKLNQVALRVEDLGDDLWAISGAFTYVNGAPRNYFALIDSNGELRDVALPPRLTIERSHNGKPLLRLNGQTGRITLESSTDFHLWSLEQEIPQATDGMEIQVLSNKEYQFFRIR